jgi:hypothetical protein
MRNAYEISPRIKYIYAANLILSQWKRKKMNMNNDKCVLSENDTTEWSLTRTSLTVKTDIEYSVIVICECRKVSEEAVIY